MGFLLSAKPTGLQKNKILELFQKRLGQTEAGFFKLGYLRNELRYEVKFCHFNWVWSDALGYAQSDGK